MYSYYVHVIRTEHPVYTCPRPPPLYTHAATNQRLEAVKAREPASVNSCCPSLGEKPTNRDLTLLKYRDPEGGQVKRLKLVDTILNEWKEVGKILGISQPKLDAWWTQTSNDPKRCCDNVMAHWLQNPPDEYPLTWRGLIDLLEDVDKFGALVQELKTALAHKV